MKTWFRCAAAAAMIVAGAAAPEPADAARQLRRGPVQIDNSLGYVLVRIGPTRNEAGRAQRLYLWRYDSDRGEVRTTRRRDPAQVPRGEDAFARLGDRPFTVAGETGIFLTSLTPGDYVIHGTESTCFCLGSYSFTVRAGEITDIGTVMIDAENGRSGSAALQEYRLPDDILDRSYAVNDVMLVRPASEGDPLPAEVANLRIARAELRPDARFINRGPVRPMYPDGLLLARAASLDPPVSGDGAAAVQRLRAGEPEMLLPRELQMRRAAERRRQRELELAREHRRARGY